MNKILTILIFLLGQLQPLSTQTLVKAFVKDKTSGEPLGFCSIGVVGQNKGCISNEEGGFELKLDLRVDSLRFQYVGFQTLTMAASTVLKNKIVLLHPSLTQLGEVEIFANQDYLYDLVEQCRTQLRKAKTAATKVYFSLDTEIANQPVEIMECYYNGTIKGSQIQNIALKNGRIGLAEQDNGHLFISTNTSEALRIVNLTTGSKYLPDIPLQFTPSKLRKAFVLTRKSSGDSTLYRIGFTPKKHRKGFEGDIWIDKNTRALLKIQLSADSCSIHPFEPYRKVDSLLYVSMEINQIYTATPEGSQLNHTSFGYEIHYLHRDLDGQFNTPPKIAHTTGRMYVYDYNKGFLLPLFEYDPTPFSFIGDYHKVANMPYNPYFWENNTGLLRTERQEDILRFLSQRGRLMHFNQKMRNNPSEGFFFEQNNVFWSDTTRVYLRASENIAPDNDRHRLRAQIFLDINEDLDTVSHFSVTVLDVLQSYFETNQTALGSCFINIYFDLCELERRTMEQQIKATQATKISEIIYQHTQAQKSLERMTNQYLQKTNNGTNVQELKRWNTIVKSALGIDNFKMMGI